ncbi:MAG: RNA-directed DNA polymerase [Verrucomicrobiia bacterium]
MGYKSRARAISETLSQTTTDVAVVADIEKFYPRIKQRTVMARFQDAVGRSEMEGGIKETAITLAQHVFAGSPGEVGMAIGPLTSHILGDLALAPVDQAMSERYPGRYFRYVDDIVIVVPRDQVENAKAQLKHALDVEGLKLNEEKTDVVSREDWLSHCPDQAVGVSEDSFEALVFRIKVFLSIYPGVLESLERAFLREGFALPFQRLLAAANRSYFRTWLHYLRRWRVLRQAVSDSEDSLILRALGLRQNLLERVRKRFDRGIPSTGMKRRWAIQEVRYAVNRLVYLLPRERFAELAHMTEGTPELIETYMFLHSVRRGEFEELLQFPGPSVAAAAAFLRRDGRTTAITRELSKEEAHSAALFSLYGVCSLNTNVLSALEHEQREYLRFCIGIPSDKREANDFSYLDEIRSLQLGRQAVDRLRMLDKRFADEEVTLFEALYIGEYYDI